jgi:hypothetical protein
LSGWNQRPLHSELTSTTRFNIASNGKQFLDAARMAIGAPMTAGYWLLVSGIYGVVFGARGRALTPLWSLFRIVVGLVVTLGMIAIAIVVFVRSSMERSPAPIEPTELVAPPG